MRNRLAMARSPDSKSKVYPISKYPQALTNQWAIPMRPSYQKRENSVICHPSTSSPFKNNTHSLPGCRQPLLSCPAPCSFAVCSINLYLLFSVPGDSFHPPPHHCPTLEGPPLSQKRHHISQFPLKFQTPTPLSIVPKDRYTSCCVTVFATSMSV